MTHTQSIANVRYWRQAAMAGDGP